MLKFGDILEHANPLAPEDYPETVAIPVHDPVVTTLKTAEDWEIFVIGGWIGLEEVPTPNPLQEFRGLLVRDIDRQDFKDLCDEWQLSYPDFSQFVGATGKRIISGRGFDTSDINVNRGDGIAIDFDDAYVGSYIGEDWVFGYPLEVVPVTIRPPVREGSVKKAMKYIGEYNFDYFKQFARPGQIWRCSKATFRVDKVLTPYEQREETRYFSFQGDWQGMSQKSYKALLPDVNGKFSTSTGPLRVSRRFEPFLLLKMGVYEGLPREEQTEEQQFKYPTMLPALNVKTELPQEEEEPSAVTAKFADILDATEPKLEIGGIYNLTADMNQLISIAYPMRQDDELEVTDIYPVKPFTWGDRYYATEGSIQVQGVHDKDIQIEIPLVAWNKFLIPVRRKEASNVKFADIIENVEPRFERGDVVMLRNPVTGGETPYIFYDTFPNLNQAKYFYGKDIVPLSGFTVWDPDDRVVVLHLAETSEEPYRYMNWENFKQRAVGTGENRLIRPPV